MILQNLMIIYKFISKIIVIFMNIELKLTNQFQLSFIFKKLYNQIEKTITESKNKLNK